ncbi:class A beta-lactamase [Sphingobium lignivorans]|uniref:Beta-lactamase n=1 Tax=Sphingobium lignivorans TaxID=2735886 RepID=A0ABR6NA92_9SPHN|nr:class A beta-lactamase [Sphingobium lignivorans]MBB5984184.1 beta-lactamase class A [Sphingobium lignivorans]
MIVGRRHVLSGVMGTALLALAGCDKRAQPPEEPDNTADETARQALAALESRSGGRLGVAMLDARDLALVGHRQDERFTMCSTFKLSLAAAMLAGMDSGAFGEQERLLITRDDAVGHAPAVRAALEDGEDSMKVLDLCAAAQIESDNGAANILLRKLGGPEALTRFWRALGDDVSRLDRYEPALNTSHGEDIRDTTSPAAMAGALRAILAGEVLKPASRERLTGWTIETRTGLRRLRAGLPADWRAGDKTGSFWGDPAFGDKLNDIAIVWRPDRPSPFFVTAYFESPIGGGRALRPQDEAVLAQAGAIAARWIAHRT